MKKINVVYEWIGPQGPICNARMPNIYDLALSIEGVSTQDYRRVTSAYLYNEVLSKFPEVFTLKPANEVTRDDLFIYDFQYIYKTPADSLFVFGVQSGLFENAKVSNKVIDCIRNGNGYILLDFSKESFVEHNFFQRIEQYFSNHNIPLYKVIYMTGCPNADELYKNFCIQRNLNYSDRIKILFWDSFEWKMSEQNSNYMFNSNVDINNIRKTFLSLNYRYRPHRLDVFLSFFKNNLINSSVFTLPEKNPETPESFIQSVDRNFSDRLNISDTELTYIQNNILPLRVDKLAEDHTRHAEMTMEIGHSTEHLYRSTMISVVTETHAYQYAIAETEKTFKPIKYKHPFILVGAPKSLHYLKKKGYKTFSNWFDESYDEIDNHRDRIVAIANLCKEIDSWDRSKKQQFMIETTDVLNHNFEVFTHVYTNTPFPSLDILGA
jgi:hypothetical protein